MPVARRGLASVRGVTVGHAADPEAASGVSVVRFDRAAPTVVDVRGGASATYDTASLALDATFGRRWALFLSGGSLYGLDAARGVRARLLETGAGHRAFGNPTPVVPISGAALFDLPRRVSPLAEYLALGYEATRLAGAGAPVLGRVGAGTGATVGKYRGRDRAMHGGVGEAAGRLLSGSVGALVAVNAAGAIRDPANGRWVAAARAPGGRLLPPTSTRPPGRTDGSTTLTVVATDLELGRPALQRIAAIVHGGLARAIVPYQTSVDGDVVFVASTGRSGPPASEPWPGRNADRVGALAAELAVRAVLGAVRAANRER